MTGPVAPVADDPVASYLQQYGGHDPVDSYLSTYGPKPSASILKPLKVPLAPADVTRTGPQPVNTQATDLTKGNLAERTLGTLGSMAQHPVDTAVGIVTAPLQAAATGARKIGQTAAEMSLPPDIAQRAFEDPDRISDTGALLAAGQLAVPLAGKFAIGAAGSKIAKAFAKVGTGTATGAVYSPNDPAVGAVIGGGMAGAESATHAGRAAPSAVPPETPAAPDAAKSYSVPFTKPTGTSATMARGTPIDMYEPHMSEAFGYDRPLAPTGPEERAAGLSIPKQTRDAVSTALAQGLTNPYAPIAAEHPELSDALQSAGAMTRSKAESFGRQMAERVTSDLTPEQKEHFESARVAANLEAEATRKSAGADALAAQAVAHRMEVREFAARDLDAENGRADAVLEAGRAQAAELAKEAPPEAPNNLDLDAATRAARQKAVAEHARRVQDTLEGAKRDADEIRQRAQQDHDLAVRKGDKAHDDAQKEAFGKKQAAARATEEAATMRARVPAGTEKQPWFQEAVQRHLATVQQFGEAAALKTGVEKGALRQTPVGYARLTPQEIINEELLKRTQETAAEGKSTTPRKGIRLKVLGQKSSVAPLLPAGAEAPPQGPVNTIRETPATTVGPTAATLETGAAKEFKGASGYSTDYATNVARDLGDKIPKAAKNGVYQALVKESMKPNATIRKLLPEENAAPGERMIAFNDQKDIVTPPSKDDPNYQAVQRFAVPPDVADAFTRYQSKEGPSSKLGKGFKAANQLVMRSILQTPILSNAVAAGHTLTEASNVSRSLPAEAGPLKTFFTGAPIIKSAHAAARALSLDMEDPKNLSDLHRLAVSGALRLSDERGQGWVDAAHHALFGPNGVDTRMRLIASKDAQSDWTKAGGSLKDPAFTAFERDRVNGHSGNYTSKNQGTFVSALNKADLAPFIAIARAKIGTSIPAIIGGGGPPGEGLGPRLLRVQRGPLGQVAQLATAGYLLSGHSPAQNAPGHETDVATGVYHLPDANGVYHDLDRSSYRFFRGDPDEAAAVLGKGAKEKYVRIGFADPASAVVAHVLAPIAYAKPGDKVSESLKAATNAVLGIIGPTPKIAVNLATGKDLYFDRDGALGSVQGIHLSKDADLTDRILAAARNMNSGMAMGMPAPTPGQRTGFAAAVGNLNPFAESVAGSAPRASAEKRDETAWQGDVVKRIFSERDPAKRQTIADEAMKEAVAAGFTGPKLQGIFTKAVNKAGVDRSDASRQRFLNQIKGTATPPAEDPVQSYLQKYGGKP